MADRTTLDRGKLTEAQQQAYWQDGFLSPLRVFPEAEAASLRGDLERVERSYLAADLPQPLNTYKRVNAHLVIEMVARAACDPRMLDVIEGILGPDIMVYAGEFFIKEPRTRQVVTMHQDLTYWGLGAIDGMVTAWLALSPATPASGCMDFVAGSHKNPILPHKDTFDEDNLLSRGQEVEVDVPDSDRVPIILKPGEMSLHHGLTIHGSGPNTSDDRRIGLVIRYIRPDMQQQVGREDHAMLVRGTDRYNHFHHVTAPTTDFAPDALEEYDRIRRMQAQVLMKDAQAGNEMYS